MGWVDGSALYPTGWSHTHDTNIMSMTQLQLTVCFSQHLFNSKKFVGSVSLACVCALLSAILVVRDFFAGDFRVEMSGRLPGEGYVVAN